MAEGRHSAAVRRQFEDDPRDLRGERDPLGEGGSSPVPGLVRRFPDRALLLATDRCFVRCAFCNRRFFVRRTLATGDRQPPRPLRGHPPAGGDTHGGAPPCGGVARSAGGVDDPLRSFDHPPLRIDVEGALDYIRRDKRIREVIVSGGDPLTLPDEVLGGLLGRLRAIRHVRLLRIGTRAPMAAPSRVRDDTARMLARHAPLVAAVHFNHPGELTPAAERACRRLAGEGIGLLNQAVLLEGVNDDARTLASLFWRLTLAGVRPYYLFQCDRVQGTSRFWTPLARGIEIALKLRELLPGHAIPHFAVDLSGEGGKAWIDPARPPQRTRGGWLLERRDGSRFLYREEGA